MLSDPAAWENEAEWDAQAQRLARKCEQWHRIDTDVEPCPQRALAAAVGAVTTFHLQLSQAASDALAARHSLEADLLDVESAGAAAQEAVRCLEVVRESEQQMQGPPGGQGLRDDFEDALANLQERTRLLERVRRKRQPSPDARSEVEASARK
eukprot:3026900-Heterocapsa_arctica.AAC.1